MFFNNYGLTESAYAVAKQREQALLPHRHIFLPGRDYITVGGLRNRVTSDGVRHLIVGSSGSGKTLSMRRPLHEVLSQMRAGRNIRAILFDPECELIGELEASGTKCKRLRFDDGDSAKLDFAGEFRSPSDGLRLAELLIPLPTNQGKEQELALAASRLIVGLHDALLRHSLRRSKPWTFCDFLVMLLGDRSRLRDFMFRYPSSKAVFEDVFPYGDTVRASDIAATLELYLGELRGMSMSWDWMCGEYITLEEWANDSYVLILGHVKSLKGSLIFSIA